MSVDAVFELLCAAAMHGVLSAGPARSSHSIMVYAASSKRGMDKNTCKGMIDFVHIRLNFLSLHPWQ